MASVFDDGSNPLGGSRSQGSESGITDDIFEDHLRRQTFQTPAGIGSLSEPSCRPLRRLLWARYLGVVHGNSPESWAEELATQRKAYWDLKEKHRQEAEAKRFDPTIANPLSRHVDNPFLKQKAHEELLDEIGKDIERTYPEVEFFQEKRSQTGMQQVLFNWCKACNPAADASESYRQGMNELVALCFYVVYQGRYAGNNESGSLCSVLCAVEQNEPDTFALFSALLERGGLREMFAIVRAKPAKSAGLDIGTLPGQGLLRAPPARAQSAVLARCDHIYHTLLKRFDDRLYAFLKGKGVEPQIFMLRWLRLLFCREFHIADTVCLWTILFADASEAEVDGIPPLVSYGVGKGPGKEGVPAAEVASAALPLVDFLAVAMIEFLRSQLLGMDESECLQRLMHFPPVEDVRTLLGMAKQLRLGNSVFKEEAAQAPTPVEYVDAARPVPHPLLGSERPSLSGEASQGAAAAAPTPPAQRQNASGYGNPQRGSLTEKGAQIFQGIVEAGKQAAETLHATMDEAAKARQAESRGSTTSEAGWRAADLWRGSASTAPGGGTATAPSVDSLQRIAELEQKVAVLEQEKSSLTEKAKQFIKQKTESLRARVVELEDQLRRENEGTGQGQGGTTSNVDTRLAEAEVRVANAVADADKERARVKELEDQLLAEQKLRSSSVGAADGADAANLARITDLEARLAAAEQARSALEAAASARTSEVDAANAEAGRLRTSCEAEIESLRAQVETADAKAEQLRASSANEATALRAKVAELETQLATAPGGERAKTDVPPSDPPPASQAEAPSGAPPSLDDDL